MERVKLKEARQAKSVHEGRKLSQEDVADAIGCSREAYSLWERGLSDPQDHWVDRLLKYFDVANPKDLDIEKTTAPRRQVLQMIVGAGATGALMSFGNTTLSPERFLRQCNVSINACWELLKYGSYTAIESTLAEYVPTLSSLAEDSSRIQTMAASLTTQAKLLQIKLATRNGDFIGRQLLCSEAVQFGELSGDPFLYPAALFWHGDTYVYCYRQPEKAIGLFKDGMKKGSMLLKSKFSMNLAIAEALQGNETNALKYVEQAEKVIPKYPEQDPAYPYVDITQGKLEKQMGRIYLALAEHSPGYAKKARDLFEEGISKCGSNRGDLGQTLIHKADAACIIGDLHEYVKSLSDGMSIAVGMQEIDLQQEAQAVFNKVRSEWKHEQVYQELLEMF